MRLLGAVVDLLVDEQGDDDGEESGYGGVAERGSASETNGQIADGET
jgi:hypothetical protein